MAKNNKAGKKAKDLPIKSLAADQAKQVVGGTVRKAGGWPAGVPGDEDERHHHHRRYPLVIGGV